MGVGLVAAERQRQRRPGARSAARAARQGRLEARWVLAIALGLRQGEALGLRWEDVDLENGTLRVRGQIQRNVDGGGGLRWVEMKTARSRRTLPLPSSVRAALREHRARQDAEKIDADSWADPGWVFATRNGTPVHPATTTGRFGRSSGRPGYG
jgi:integrase